ncbi:MAG: hypothetical protein N4A48_13145 [Tepidibacter sp.]|jgi:hypothetical protein|uniref:hypothetical protein n=1 Tax=Tepidibacter sp. TaxID=2529387 RepID=UPI0025D0D18D|nr:hypothetical protein [Tepidibacter sp.]MCT4509677.1 hypothetical protein [Tepidibacter sp.]
MENLSRNQLRAIASECSQYSPIENQFTSSVRENEESCSKCNNYQNGKCTLDLIDEIRSNMQ